MATRADLEGKKVTELKEECQKLGLATTGKKAELIDRILEARTGAPAAAAPAAPAEAPAADNPAEADVIAAADPAAAENGGAHASGKHKRIEFTLDAAAEKAAEAEKIIKLGKEEGPAVAPKSPDPQEVAGHIDTVATLTAEERKRLRGEKFGLPEVDKKKKRAERFGLTTPEDEEEKKLKRQQRFGAGTKEGEKAAMTAHKAELLDPAKLKARAERFGKIMTEEDKKKARADRFKAAA